MTGRKVYCLDQIPHIGTGPQPLLLSFVTIQTEQPNSLALVCPEQMYTRPTQQETTNHV